MSFFNELIFKSSQRGEHAFELGQKYSAAQRRIGVSQISFDLQTNLYNKIFETTNVGTNLDLFAFSNQILSPFAKIMQNFILLYNI